MRRDGTRRHPLRAARPLLATLLVAALTSGCAARGAPAAWQTPSTVDGSASPTSLPPAAPTPSVTPIPTASSPLRFAFPVRGSNVSYHPTHSAYPGTDIFANCGTPVVAVTDGKVLEVSRVDRFDKSGPLGPYNGGLFVSLLGDDGARYYGSHLSRVLPGIEAGVRVRSGQQVGTVGHTGNANNVCHLHFGVSPACTGHDGWWIRRGVVWPAPYLDAWRAGRVKSAAAEVRKWQQQHGCPKEPNTTSGTG